jgi:hypothetical protein
LLELQQEWAKLEGSAERLLAKGEAFQRLTLEIERGVRRDVALDSARDGRESGNDAPPLEAPGIGAYGRPQHQTSAGFRSAAQRGRSGYDTRRRSSGHERHWVPRSGWMRVAALVVSGGVLAALVYVAAQKVWLPEQSLVSAPPPPAVVEPEQQNGEQEQKLPDVVSERAALDAPSNQ